MTEATSREQQLHDLAKKLGNTLMDFTPGGSEYFVKVAGDYSVFARLNCPSADDDSFWVKMDDSPFTMLNGLATRGSDWVKLNNFRLEAGRHTLTTGYREDGAMLDKICITNDRYAPVGMGEPAQNIVIPP